MEGLLLLLASASSGATWLILPIATGLTKFSAASVLSSHRWHQERPSAGVVLKTPGDGCPPSVSRRPGAPKRVKPLRGCPQMQRCRCWLRTLQLRFWTELSVVPYRGASSLPNASRSCFAPIKTTPVRTPRLSLTREGPFGQGQAEWLWWRRRALPPRPVHVWLVRYTPISLILSPSHIP